MCRLEERVYISAEGNRSRFEDAFPCDKSRKGKLCSKVKRRTTEYFPKGGVNPPQDGTTSPINPPTPTGTGSYLVQQRRPSSGGRPSTRDGQKTIIIDFGAKSHKTNTYSAGSSKRASFGATYEDVAAESQDEDASHAIRTGFPEQSLPSYAHGRSDAYSTTSTVPHGHHHRHTSPYSSNIGSNRTPSLYVASDPDYDLLASTRGKKAPLIIHSVSPAGAPSSVDTEFRSDSGYSSFTARTTSSAASSWSTPDASAPITKSFKDDDPKPNEKRISSEAKQVIFADTTRKNRRPKLYQTEPKEFPAIKQTPEHAAKTTDNCVDPDCVTSNYNTRSQRRRRSSVSSRDTSSVVSAHDLPLRETGHARRAPAPTYGGLGSSVDPVMDPTGFYLAQPPPPNSSPYNPYVSRGLDGRPLAPWTPVPSPPKISNEPDKHDAQLRDTIVMQQEQRLLMPEEEMRTARSGFKEEVKDSLRERDRMTPRLEKDIPRRVEEEIKLREDKRMRLIEAERKRMNEEDRIRLKGEEKMRLNQEKRTKSREEEKNQNGPRQFAGFIFDTLPQKEPQLGSAKAKTISPLLQEKNKPEEQSMMPPGFGDSSAMSIGSENLPETEVLLLRESGIYIHPQLSIRPRPDTSHKDTSDHLERSDSLQKKITIDKQNEPQPKKDVTKELVPIPRYVASDILPVHPDTSSDSRNNAVESDYNTSGFVEKEKGFASSENSAYDSDEISEDCDVHIDDALNSAMNVVKNLLLRELLQNTLPEATDASGGTNTSSSGSGGSSTSQSLASSSVNSQTTPKGKRSRGCGRDPSDGDGDNSDDDDDRPKKKGGQGFPDRFPQRRLKCPFYQRHPDKYTKAACRGSGFVDMAKLKDHIKRVHTQPLRCSRCWLQMESDEAYSEHLQQENICKKAPEPQEDRIRPQVLKRLDFKKAPYSNARNVEEKWRILFKVLFPSDITIPSPYEQQGMSPQLERALYEALEEELSRELALVIEPIMTRIKGCIPAIIERCREKLQNSTPSSDDEVVFTPLSTPSVTSNGKSGCRSTSRRDSPHSDSAKSPCPESPLATSLSSDTSDNGGQARAVQQAASSARYSNTIDPQDISAMRSDTDCNIEAGDQHDPSHYSRGQALSNIPEVHLDSMNQANYAYQPETHALAAICKSAQMSSNEGVLLEPYQLGRDFAQQDLSFLPGHLQSDWPGDEASWLQGNAKQVTSADQLIQPLDNSQDWESFMGDFDVLVDRL